MGDQQIEPTTPHWKYVVAVGLTLLILAGATMLVVAAWNSSELLPWLWLKFGP